MWNQNESWRDQLLKNIRISNMLPRFSPHTEFQVNWTLDYRVVVKFAQNRSKNGTLGASKDPNDNRMYGAGFLL